jgi:2-amino-4-hydroxy-6-hydroxymethyldihydropteridine diphosphokinase
MMLAMHLLEVALCCHFTHSAIYETAPWGKTDQPAFLNSCSMAAIKLPAKEVLARIQEIEAQLGRTRTEHWGRRTIDIDILFYGDCVIHSPKLIVPHPLLTERLFVLVPLAEIAPHYLHPVTNSTMQQLLHACPDKSHISKFATYSDYLDIT